MPNSSGRPPQRSAFDDTELLRYSRHIMLPALDVKGQLAITNSSVLLLGLGGLGSAAGLYLAASGVGQLVLADDDLVEGTNLQRQVVHHEDAIGMSKVASAARTLRSVNSAVMLTEVNSHLTGPDLAQWVSEVDVVCDCTDNFSTRCEVNRLCSELGKPLVSGAAIRFEGQVSVFDSRDPACPCYRCLYSNLGDDDPGCSMSGVLSPLVGVIGSMQAVETLKLLAQFGQSLAGRLLIYDAMVSGWREFRVPRDPHCAVCGSRND